MAVPKFAKVAQCEKIQGGVRLINFVLCGPDPLGFAGGQYIIVNTGLELPGGKIVKRAYSILSADSDQLRFAIAVKQVGSGPGSNFMHQLSVGQELPFSGPWGQFRPDSNTVQGPALIVATDTGITAALGLAQGAAFAQAHPGSQLIWLVSTPDYFLPPEWAASRLKVRQTALKVKTVLPAGDPARAQTLLRDWAEVFPIKLSGSVYLAGDGDLLYPLSSAFTARGCLEKDIKLECFFNNPFKKVAS